MYNSLETERPHVSTTQFYLCFVLQVKSRKGQYTVIVGQELFYPERNVLLKITQ